MQGTRIFLLAFVVLAFASCSVASSETVHKFPKYMLVAVEKYDGGSIWILHGGWPYGNDIFLATDGGTFKPDTAKVADGHDPHESGMDDKTAYEYVARFKSVIKVEDKKHILAKVGGNTALWASFNTGKVETSGMGHDWLFVHELSKHGGQFEPPDSYLFAVWSAYAAYVLPEIINKKGCNGAKGLSAAIKSPKAGQRCSVCVELSPTGSKVPNHISIALTDLKDCGKGGGSFIETVPSTPSHSLSSTISSSIPSPSSTSYPQAYRSKLGYKSDQGILSEVQPHSHPIIV